MQKSISDVVSVVIPVCNAERFLEDTLKSVFAQTYPHIEIIAVDDGSTDRSVDILESYSDRLVLIKQKYSSAAAARNRGVREARGKWIAFLDADDLWSPDKIQRQLDACGRCVWSYTDCIFMGGVNDGKKDGDLNKKYQGRVLEMLVHNNFVGTSSVLIQRQAYLDAGGFSESLQFIEDWELWIRLATAHEIAYLNEPLVRYRVHSSSASRNTRNTLPYHMKVIERAFAEGGPAERLRHLMPSAKARSYSTCSQIAEEEGDYSHAFRCSVLACRQEPLGIRLWERAFKSFVKYLMYSIGRPVAQHAWWLAMIYAFEPVVPV
jgi:glycosyltransferase involved in cell wall biosynthesis